MSFRIDLTFKDNVHIFLVVVRNQININYQPSSSASLGKPAELRENFRHLVTHFELDNQVDPVRGDDPEHVKRHHVYEEEAKVFHHHIGFDKDVTPQILQEFLEGILKAQEENEHEAIYQFIDRAIVDDTLKTFSNYYKGFTGTLLQEQFLDERKLSKWEKISLAKDAAEKGTLSHSDKEELTEAGINVDNIAPRVPVKTSLDSLANLLFFQIMQQLHENESYPATINMK